MIPAELRQLALVAAAALRKAGVGDGAIMGRHVAGPTRGRSVVEADALKGLPELLEALVAAATPDPANLHALRESVAPGLASPISRRFRGLEMD